MKFLEKVTKNEARLQRFVGLNYNQLNLLVKKIRPLWEEAEMKRLQSRERKREIGGGHPYSLATLQAKVIVVLIYYKQYPTQEFLGCMAGIDQSSISRLLKKMLPLIEWAADPTLKSYLNQAKSESQERIRTFEELFVKHPDLRDISTDACEQQCFRSHQYEIQKKYYSGKTKQHAIKTQISVSARGRILDVSSSYPGSVHDKAIIDNERTIEKFDKRVPQRFDSGYQGLKKEYPHHYLILPIKKPKNGELIALEKEHNKANSKRRIVVEHAFARIQKFRISAITFRQPLGYYNQVFRNIVALLNFKLNYRAVIA